MPARLKLPTIPTTDLARSARLSLDCPASKDFFEAQLPLSSSWLRYAALARATRTRVQVAKALAQLQVLLLLFVSWRGGHAHKAQVAKHSSDGPGALGAPVAGLPGIQVFFSKRTFRYSPAG